jgi:ribonuclease J
LNAPNGLRVIPLGGLGEIGMNCMLLEYEDEIIVIDCGLMFSDLDHFGVEFVIPDFTYLVERKDKVKALVMTHGHEDHIGALPLLIKAGVRAPVHASHFTSLMIEEKLKEHGISIDLQVFKLGKEGESFSTRHFKISPVSVNHSIVDAAALIIDTPVGRVIHTGDFKIDPTPFYGSVLDHQAFKKAGDEGVLLLLSDSTNVERCEHSLSEASVYKGFESLFAQAEGLTIVSMFSSNVARMGQIFELARKMDKRVALSGRSVEQNVRLGIEAGYLKDAQARIIGLDEIDRYTRKDVIVISTGSQGEYRSALIRIANGEHSQIQIEPGDKVLMSSRFIPGNERSIGRMINSLFKQGAEVLYEAVHDIHVSGHATRPELGRMLEWTRPLHFVPIHGEYRHLVHHAKLAREKGVRDENVHVVTNGAVMEFGRERFELVEQMEEPRVLVEGRQGNDISKLVLKDRRQMGEKGIVFSLIVRNADDGRIIAGPEIIARGLAHENVEGWLIEEARNLVKKVLAEHARGITDRAPGSDLQETIRVELRRFFNNNIGRKPIVMPLILDL